MTFVIPMAGLGSRFKKEGYTLPKYMIEIKGKTLFEYSMDSLPISIADKLIFICLREHEIFLVSNFINNKVQHDNIKIVFLDQVSRGQAETVYKAKEYIDENDELLIYNIDTFFISKTLKERLQNKVSKKDGVLGAFIDNSNDDKWSFARLDANENIIKTTEKEKISNFALTGVYHFIKASDFLNIAKDWIKQDKTVRNEFYIAPMYNDLIKLGKKYVLDIVDKFIPLGTPEEVKKFDSQSGVILTAAKADITICEVFGDLPTGLISINGKPIIFFILQQFLDARIYDIYIGVDYQRERVEEVVNLYFKNKLNIYYIYTDKSKGIGNSLLTILDNVKTERVVINLADTYVKNLNISKLINTIVVSSDFLDEKKWAIVEIDNNKNIINFKDKEVSTFSKKYALVGIYSLNNISIFNNFSIENNNLQLTDLIKYYYKIYPSLSITETKEWLDFGHIDKYYISKKRLIQSRGFNSLEYNDLLGTITKKSKNNNKFREEIKWQLNLPSNLKVLSPRVLDYSLDNPSFITMEFYSYPTLSEIWLFSDLNENIFFSIIDKLFKILELFKNNNQSVSIENYFNIYRDKTKNRVLEVENKDILELMRYKEISINGIVLKNWSVIEKDIFKCIADFYNINDNCLIHGDFCLSNILYDLRSGIVRLIDPRGIWGNNENGDIKYDIAKLRHSINGGYDYIVNDLFQIKVERNNINYSVYHTDKTNIKEYLDKQISNYWDLNQIKLIEGLLFLSMIPLHDDNHNRQIVMYVKAIELLNNVLEI
jgi:dTDP-glucose pyrophosphorylase